MPINQSRLITQNIAAILSLKALNTIRAAVRSQSLYISQGTMSHTQAYLELINLISDNEQLFPPNPAFAPEFEYMASTFAKVIHVVSIEQNHFSRHANINARNAANLRAARDRKTPDRQRRTSHPHSVYETSVVIPPINAASSPPLSTSIPTQTDEELAREIEEYNKAHATPTPYEFQTPPSQPFTPTDYSNELHPDLTPPPKIQSYIPPPLDPAGDIDPGDPDFDPTKPPPSGTVI
jgi:hypothetical protein